MFHTPAILSVADKGVQLIPQDVKSLVCCLVIDTGHPFIDQLMNGRVLLIDIAVDHYLSLDQNALSAVMGTAR